MMTSRRGAAIPARPLGELEQVLLLAILQVGEEAYATPILALLEERTGRRIARGALHTTLDRLEAKGLLRSTLGEPLPERGGRPRRYFAVTAAGRSALARSRRVLLALWRGLDALAEET